ncbi:unnamed protein product, partial [Ectocarpus sp. 12 AP-2014]
DEKPVIAEKPSLQEKMSLAGIGNAAVGVAAVELAKNFVTPNADKPATKKDIEDLKMFIKARYLRIKNLRNDANGRLPYYDVNTGNIVYF